MAKLTTAQLRRLVKLAHATKRKPEDLLRFVLRDELGLVENDVQASRIADAQVKQLGAAPHPEAQQRALAVIGAARVRRSSDAA